jgi:hypothetical protein
VAFYQLNANKWVQLPSPIEQTEHSQLTELAKKHWLKGFNPHSCSPDRDILKLRSWTDDDTAILYALLWPDLRRIEYGVSFHREIRHGGKAENYQNAAAVRERN